MNNNIQLKNFSLAFQNTFYFRALSTTFETDKITMLMGKSGVGKTSLLNAIAGFYENTPGIKQTGSINDVKGAGLQDKIAYMTQEDLLLPWLTCLENVCLASRLSSQKISINKAIALLTAMGLADKIHNYPHTLSGGMRQRVALARTLIQDKPILLMDEPFTSLDFLTRIELEALALPLLKNKTVLWITHDPLEALRLGDTIYLLSHMPVQLSAPISIGLPKPRHNEDPALLPYQSQLITAWETLTCAS